MFAYVYVYVCAGVCVWRGGGGGEMAMFSYLKFGKEVIPYGLV